VVAAAWLTYTTQQLYHPGIYHLSQIPTYYSMYNVHTVATGGTRE
jgi:hypothetical protein